uniref:Uncharacterized protein n=1 Tax=viral metagenome TaxID=1070528 RepID=A0A6M3LZK1_9ZZZZ
MSDFCNICKEFMFSGHTCLPPWKIFHQDYLGSEPETVHARNAEDAAVKYGEEFDINNHPLWSDDEIILIVEDALGARKKFVVTREMTPHYYPKEVVEDVEEED